MYVKKNQSSILILPLPALIATSKHDLSSWRILKASTLIQHTVNFVYIRHEEKLRY